MNIYFSKKFAKLYKKLPLSIKLKAEKKEALFRKDPNTPALKTHKLTGELQDFYSFSVDYHYRIVFHSEEKTIGKTTEVVTIFDTVGTHEVYK